VKAELEIQAMVERETAAWDRQDAQALVELFHIALKSVLHR
jgi:hypothetical protein